MQETISKKDIEVIKIDEPFIESDEHNNLFWKEIEKSKIKRLNIYHWVIHIMAFIVIIPFICLILLGQEIPDNYSTIVSVIIGFYFARSLFN